jgi:general secretion pathway protein J
MIRGRDLAGTLPSHPGCGAYRGTTAAPPVARAHGFTLLEMLVALAIFAVLGAIAYTGLNAVLRTRASVDQAAGRLAALQTTLNRMQRDIEQAVLRPIRDAYGDSRPALLGGGTYELPLELTRGGWSNPLQRRRATLQRVAYRVQNNQLIRMSWPVLDRAPDTKPYESRLLTQVDSLRIRFLGSDHQWHTYWPILGTDGTPQNALPNAVEVTLNLHDWGQITRVFALGAG